MPDTRGQSGIEHFEAHARVKTETSSCARFSTFEAIPGTGGDGPITLETRHAPLREIAPGDQPAPAPAASSGKKSKKK